ncbi:hypothetical protein ACVINZ_001597 [Mesorhizobium jarvisii]
MSAILPTIPPGKHYWPVYLMLCALGALAVAAIHGEIKVNMLSYGVGLIGVPAFVGWLTMRKAKGTRQVIVGYIVFIALAAILLYQEARHQVNDMQTEIETGCLTKNTAVAALTDESQKKQFCGCYSSGLASWTVQHAAVAAITFRPLSNAPDDPAFVAFATQVWNQCNRELVNK